ncbi:hypothetical protein ACIQHV_32425 [Bacillus bombysepticus]|uniref:Uncharacterized protein n=1 Tax=Bacillus thuringiensis serovar kumamotoensis TaxID=132267 RepID=A0A9X6JJC9_BACUK|nr:hypothetical protein [Bacillus thuringiensis]MEC2872811.1 hypothetical protein [Bacillus cereus]OTZ67911.1 hypothetical protein BK769_29240 [Bacillus thuringiensis serovar kumamtoensis]
MKKYLILFLSVILLFVLVLTIFLAKSGVGYHYAYKYSGHKNGEFTANIFKEKTLKDSFSVNLKEFRGYRYYKVDLHESGYLNIHVNKNIKKGQVRFSLINPDGSSIINTEEKDFTKKVKINQKGTYKIQFSGDFTGEIDCSWEMK